MKTFKNLTMLSFFFLAGAMCYGQSGIVTIDGIYIERDTVDVKGKPRAISFRVNEKPIVDGDVIVFDIPGFGEYLEASNAAVSDVTLLVDGNAMTEMPAFVESLESGIVRFEFNEEDLTSEHRQKLYNRSGGSVKKLRLGIRAGETNPVNFSPKARFYFDKIDIWETVGLVLILGFILMFGTLIVVFPTILKESVPSQFRTVFANFVRPEIDKLLPRPADEEATEEAGTISVLPAGEKKPAIRPLTQQELSEYVELSKIKLAYSFSKSQLVFWTLIVISSFIYIWGMTNNFNPINTTALILLGISSATLAAGSIVGGRQAAEALVPASDPSRPPANRGAAESDRSETENLPVKRVQAFLESRVTHNNYFRDILSDNQGLSIPRVQVVAFNVLFGIIFLKSVVLDYTMPAFGETELLLLGLSNGTYAFLKSSETK